MRKTLALAAACLVLGGASALADTVILVGGKKIENVTVSQNDDEWVVVNRWNCPLKEMKWGVEDKDRIPKAKVQEVILGAAPIVEYRGRTVKPLTADERRELGAFCEKHGLKDEAAREKKLAKALEDAKALEESSTGECPAGAPKGDPVTDPVLRRLEREYVKLTDAAALESQWKLMQERATTRPRAFLERARRSAAQPTGRRDKVALTVRAKEAPGGTYCIYVPKSYDPLVPTPLVVGLHGGGPGGVDGKMVTGSGEEAMPFYQDLAEQYGWIVVCPSAIAPSWSAKENEPLVDSVLAEMLMLYDVDESRIYLTGHSMGGYGTWYWGPHRAETWAAIAPCAGDGGPGGVDSLDLPTYIYHGADDKVVGCGGDRAAAKSLLDPEKKKKGRFDGVYAEFDGVGHGFPDVVRADIFRWFSTHVNDRKKKCVEPVASFVRKADKEEIRCFGDPASAPVPGAAEGDAKLADLVAKLERGGGSSAEAADELAKRKDAPTVKAVARVLKSRKANTDVRVAAARALGGIATPEALEALSAEVGNEDWKIVDEVVVSLGRIGGAATVEPLGRAAKVMGAFWDKSIQGGQMYFTEYEVRCQCFGKLADAYAASGAPDAAVAALEKECVQRVYTPKTKYTVPIDERFVEIPPRARLDLARKLRACFEKLAAPRGKEILTAIAAAWSNESSLVSAVTQ